MYTGLDGSSKAYPLRFIKLGTSMCHEAPARYFKYVRAASA